MSAQVRWLYGQWTMTATYDANEDMVRVNAVRYTKTQGTRHGAYVLMPDGDVLTVSMADVRVNKHVRTTKIRKMLTTLKPCPACNAEPGEPCNVGCIGYTAHLDAQS